MDTVSVDSAPGRDDLAPRRVPDPGIAGRLLYHLLPVRRRTVLDNLRHVFGQRLNEPEIRRLAQAHYRHLWRCVREIAIWAVAPGRLVLRLEVADAAWEFDVRRSGALLLMAHLGNFELAPLAGLREYPEYRGLFHVIRRPLPLRWLDALVRRVFSAAGIGVIPDRGALQAAEQTVRAGGSVAFVLDQHASPRYGVVVDFLGRPASTFRSLAELSMRLDKPVLPYLTWREPDGAHVLRFDEPIFPVRLSDQEEAVRATTQAYSDVLERFILRHPEQWFWVHRRWKASIASHRRRAERAAYREPAARGGGSGAARLRPGEAAGERRSAPRRTATERDTDPTRAA